jgi:glycosyltransferase involved in cell wall biosynthesis
LPRILFVHHRPQLGGGIRSLSLLVSELDAEWEPHAIVPEGPSADLLRAAGAVVHPAPVPAFTHTWDVQYRGWRWLVLARELAWTPRHVWTLRKVLRQVRPSVVHLNDSVMLASGAVAAHARVPVVWHLRSSLASQGSDRRARLICTLLGRWGHTAIAIDEDVAATFELQIPVEVVPNPVQVLDGPALDLHAPPGCVTVGYFGYLRRQKGWPQFLAALRALVDADVAVFGVVIGGAIRPHASFHGLRGRVLKALGVPDEDRDFDRAVDALGLADHLSRLPFLSDPDSVYRSLDIVVFPNQGAGLGRPVLEAAAHGKPVVASGSPHGGGVLLPGETGILLESGTPETLTRALRELILDPALRHRLGDRARERAALLHGPARHARAIERIYTAIISRELGALTLETLR